MPQPPALRRLFAGHHPLLWSLAVLLLAACTGQPVAQAPLPTPPPVLATATLPPPAIREPTATPLPPPTLTPTTTPTATYTPPPTPPATSAAQTCANPPPGKPDYNHYWLNKDPWPTPEPEPETHFWLTKPFAGGGRLITSGILPYGFDGLGRYLLHNGIDMAEPLGTPVLAVADGTIVVAQTDEQEQFGWRCNWYSHLVVLELDDRWRDQPVYVLYGHVLNIKVQPGQRVRRGEPVAEVGVGGAAVLPHLHLEVRVGRNAFNATRNPWLWFGLAPTRGLLVGRLIDPLGRPWQGFPVQITGLSENTDNLTGWTYLGDPDNIINPDESFAENFVVGDLKPGRYRVSAQVQGTLVEAEVTVSGGEVTTVELVSPPYKTPTPAPDG